MSAGSGGTSAGDTQICTSSQSGQGNVPVMKPGQKKNYEMPQVTYPDMEARGWQQWLLDGLQDSKAQELLAMTQQSHEVVLAVYLKFFLFFLCVACCRSLFQILTLLPPVGHVQATATSIILITQLRQVLRLHDAVL